MSNNNNWFSKLFISEAKKAIEYHNSVGGGGSGGGGSTGLIEVDEFPTSDVDSSSVYKKITTTSEYECLIAMDGQLYDGINMLQTQGINATLTAVDNLDSVTNPLVSDGQTQIHIYIPKNEGIGYIYGPFGVDGSNTWLKFSAVAGEGVTDVVVTNAPSTFDDMIIYWVSPSSRVEYGIPDSEVDIYNYSETVEIKKHTSSDGWTNYIDELNLFVSAIGSTQLRYSGYKVVENLPDNPDVTIVYVVTSENKVYINNFGGAFASELNTWGADSSSVYFIDDYNDIDVSSGNVNGLYVKHTVEWASVEIPDIETQITYLKSGDFISDPVVYIDTSKNIDEAALASLEYDGGISLFGRIGYLALAVVDVAIYGGTSYPAGSLGYGVINFITTTVLYASQSVPDDVLTEFGVTQRGWVTDRIVTGYAGTKMEMVLPPLVEESKLLYLKYLPLPATSEEITSGKCAWNGSEWVVGTSDAVDLLKELIDGSLTSITIPDGVTTIKDYAFYGRDNLKKVIIPDGVTTIGHNAFTFCDNLENITFPNSVTDIGVDVFRGCYGLKNITIPDGVDNVSQGMFRNCNSLTEITIPDHIKYIESHAFEGCSNLTKVTMPNGVEYISQRAFYNCASLKTIDFSTSTRIPGLERTDGVDKVFGDKAESRVFIVPDVLYDEWIVSEYWSYYASQIVKASEYANA